MNENIRWHRWPWQALRWGRHGAILIMALAGFVGCRATVGQVIGQQFISPMYAFEVPLPGGEWVARTNEPAALVFAHTRLAAGISLSVTCGQERQASLSVLARHLLFGLQEVDILRQDPQALDGLPALQTVARARLDTAGVWVNSYVVRHHGCVYDLVYVASPQDYAQGEPGFARMLAGFRFRAR